MKEKQTEILVFFDIVSVSLRCEKEETGKMAALFQTLSEIGANIDLISLLPIQNEGVLLSFSVFSCDFLKVLKKTKEMKSLRVEVQGGYAKICMQGKHFPFETGIASLFFAALGQAECEVAMISSSDQSLSALVLQGDLDRVLECLETSFPDARISFTSYA